MMSRRRPPTPPANFESLFSDFLGTTLAIDPAPRLPPGLLPDAWLDATTDLVARAGPEYHARQQSRETCLFDAFASIAPLVNDASIASFAASRIVLAPMTDLRTSGDHDIFYAKINHGFWEQMYAAIASPDPAKMRIKDPGERRVRYLSSGFSEALAAVMNLTARPEGDQVTFPGVHFAASLASGTHDHADVLAGFQERGPVERQIVVGAAIGITSWFEAMFPGHTPSLFDGSFPKRGLETGALRATLSWAADAAQRVIFVVPPHLAGVRLADVTTAQETFLVPATTIHESWAACLHATAGHIFARLHEDQSVLVVTQSAVFSAILGLFLAHMKPRLFDSAARLRYFDLGQALDTAVPDAGGRWARHHAQGDLGLFRMAGA